MLKRFAFLMLAGGIALPPGVLWAQQQNQPKLDLAFTYNAQRSNLTSNSTFWAQGGGAELTGTFYHGLGMAANVTGSHTGNVSPTGVGLTLVTATFGPVYTRGFARSGKMLSQWSVFGESLLGVANALDSVFPAPNGAQASANGLALQVGGGADLRLSGHVALRVVKADWLRTQLPNGDSNVQNSLQLATGIVFRFH